MATRSARGRSARSAAQPQLPLAIPVEVVSYEAGPDLPSMHDIRGPTEAVVMDIARKMQAQLTATHNVEFGGDTPTHRGGWRVPVYVTPKHRGRGKKPQWLVPG